MYIGRLIICFIVLLDIFQENEVTYLQELLLRKVLRDLTASLECLDALVSQDKKVSAHLVWCVSVL